MVTWMSSQPLLRMDGTQSLSLWWRKMVRAEQFWFQSSYVLCQIAMNQFKYDLESLSVQNETASQDVIKIVCNAVWTCKKIHNVKNLRDSVLTSSVW